MFTKATYLIKEHAPIFKVTDTYDIIDPETNTIIAEAKENVSWVVQFFRVLISKSLMPTTIEIRSTADQKIHYKLKRGVKLFTAKIEVLNGNDVPMGFLKSRFFTIGGHFDVHGANGNKIAEVKGEWTGWNFKFTDTNGQQLGLVSKSWAGIGKELFTSADNYVINLSDVALERKEVMPLLIISGLAIDVIYKEKN